MLPQALIGVAGRQRQKCSGLLAAVRLASSSSRAFSISSGDALHKVLQLGAAKPEDSVVGSSGFTSGSMQLERLPGKGRGMMANRDIAAGELLLLQHPLAVITGPQDSAPGPSALISLLDARSLDAHHAKQLQQLFAGGGVAQVGTSASTPQQRQQEQQQLSELQRLMFLPAPCPPLVQHLPNTPSTPPSPSPSSESSSSSPNASAVAYNAFGDAYDDLAAAALLQRTPRSHIGLWPGFALFNHSCVPNCVHFVVAGQLMVVRAAQDIKRWSELTISYLGREEFSPAAVRQEALQQRYGFRCKCLRCTTEGSLKVEQRRVVQDVYEACQALAPQLERLASGEAASTSSSSSTITSTSSASAAGMGRSTISGTSESGSGSAAAAAAGPGGEGRGEGGGDGTDAGEQLQEMQAALQELSSKLHDVLVDLDAVQAPHVQASAFQLLELLYMTAEMHAPGGPQATMYLEAMHSVLDTTSRGSELQVFQACELLRRRLHELKTGKCRHDEVEEAAERLQGSLTARYGTLSGAPLKALTQANMRVARQFL